MTFDEWMDQVDAKISATCGFTSSDLPDQTYMDWYRAGYRPGEAAAETLEDAGWK